MPLTAAQWRTVITKAQADLEKAEPLIDAYDANTSYPAGLAGDARYAGSLTAAQRTAIRTEFFAEIDAVIANLQAARTAP